MRVGDEEAPALNRLLARSGEDRSVVSDAKRHYQTRRPFIGNDLPICEPRTSRAMATILRAIPRTASTWP